MTESQPVFNGTAVLYARVSTEDHDQDPQTQVRNIKKWCAERGIEIVGEYVEEKSAKDTNRPALRQCLGHVMLGHITMLIAWAPSRLSRDTDDMGQIVKICKERGTMIQYVSESFGNPESGPAKLMNLVSTWQGEEERTKLRTNTKAGMESARIKGKHCGRMLAFCFSHRVAENQKRIQTEGEHRTYISSVDTVMDFARQGITYTRVAHEIMHIAPDTLKSALIHEGLFADYQDLCRKARGKPQEGVSPTRGAETPETVPTRGEVS